MKLKTLLASALILSSSTLYAENVTKDQFCDSMATNAENLQSVRQMGASLSDALKTIDGLSGDIKQFYRDMVIDAWETPAMSTKPMQEKVAREFRDEWHLKCLKTVED